MNRTLRFTLNFGRVAFLSALLCILFVHSVEAQLTWFKSAKKEAKKEPGKKPKKGDIKDYKEVITDMAETSVGLITTHKVGDKHYFEIADDLLEEEILVVSRIAGFVKGLNFGGAGTKSRPQQVVRWQRRDNKIMLRSVSYNSVASFEDPIYQSVRNNNFEPVIHVFDIKAFSPDSTAYVIDIAPLFTSDIPMIGAMYDSQRKQFGIKGLDNKRSYISSLKSFPENTEVRHVLTYKGSKLPDNQLTGTMSVEMNQSFVKLPEDPWVPRHFDSRVGYFSLSQTDYSLDKQKAAKNRFITRWRLEPKDKEAYARGELVEPIKQIVYYIDPATPEKWRPYLKQGVNDWNAAFEQAGFKNAIIAKDPPTKEEDPDWSPEDVRYSVIRYVSTDIQNAMGPHVHDPRTGEILESDIIWYHNVMNLLRNWFFIQTSVINPDARKVQFEDEVMGRLIRFVSAHEVGHTLGLPHNMGSSVAYPVDSLRSPSFTQKMGVAPSIMDYARFNYVAQPEDGDVGLMPDVGVYDKWSIEWGYRYYDTEDKDAERPQLAAMILEHVGDPLYRFGRQRRLPLDPSSQTEDLGDDSMEASELGLRNLKRIVPNLIEWTADEGKDFDDLDELYGQVLGQYNRYMGHVVANIGGVYEHYKTYDEEEVVYTHVDKEKQQRAMAFLDKHLMQTPTWVIDEEILRRIEPAGNNERIRRLQDRAMSLLLRSDRLARMVENESINGGEAYGPSQFFGELNASVFSEIDSGGDIDIYRRSLQRSYIEQLGKLVNSKEASVSNSDVPAIARGNLRTIQNKIRGKASGSDLSAYHLADLIVRIEEILMPKRD